MPQETIAFLIGAIIGGFMSLAGIYLANYRRDYCRHCHRRHPR